MHPYWTDIIAPALDALKPARVLEIGSERGLTTQRLLGACQRLGAHLDVIEPKPQYDPAKWRSQFGDHFTLHQARSLTVLPTLDPVDFALIDGDHNWYTVFHELQAIAARCADQGAPLPVILLHDVGWPYGRRDLYYDPDSIPAEHRHPWRRAGMAPGRSQLLTRGGFNAQLCHAEHEGGPRNGVLTAVEDFLKEQTAPMAAMLVPAFHGLAILLPQARADEHAEAASVLARWRMPTEVGRMMAQVEAARIGSMMQRLPSG